MRVALLLAGHMRSYEYTFPYLLKSFILPNTYSNSTENMEINLFIITYEKLHNKKSIHDDSLQCQFILNENHVRKLYHPYLKILEIKNEKDYQDNSNDHHMINRRATMLKLIKDGGELIKKYEKDQSIKYDLIIRTRPDLLIDQEIKLNQLDLNYLYVFNHKPVKFPMSDFIVFGKAKEMYSYLDFYDHIDRLYKKYGLPKSTEWFHQTFFKDQSLKHRTYRIPIDKFQLVRFTNKIDSIYFKDDQV